MPTAQVRRGTPGGESRAVTCEPELPAVLSSFRSITLQGTEPGVWLPLLPSKCYQAVAAKVLQQRVWHRSQEHGLLVRSPWGTSLEEWGLTVTASGQCCFSPTAAGRQAGGDQPASGRGWRPGPEQSSRKMEAGPRQSPLFLPVLNGRIHIPSCVPSGSTLG